MNCHQARQLFSAYLEGELNPKEKDRLKAHLANCPHCQAVLDIMAGLSSSIKNLPEIEPPATLLQQLYSIPELALTPEKTALEKGSSGWKFWLSPAFQPVLIGLTVIMVAFSLLFFTSPGKTWQKEISFEIHRGYSQAQKILAKAGVLTDKVKGYQEDFLAALEAKNLYKSK